MPVALKDKRLPIPENKKLFVAFSSSPSIWVSINLYYEGEYATGWDVNLVITEVQENFNKDPC